MKKYLKLRKHTFKSIHKFFESVTDKPVFNEGLVFSDKLFHVNSKTRVSNTREAPQGGLMPSPRAAIKLRMPHPGTDNLSKCPAVALGGGGGGMGTAGTDRCINLRDRILDRNFNIVSRKSFEIQPCFTTRRKTISNRISVKRQVFSCSNN